MSHSTSSTADRPTPPAVDLSIHLERHAWEAEIHTLTTDSGRTFHTLAVGPVKFFGSLDDFRRIRDTIDLFLADNEVVPPDDPTWDAEDGRWADTRTEAPEVPAPLTAAELDALPDDWTPDEPRSAALMPISGGSDDDVPHYYEPTPADWADYDAAMATADYLAGFNAVRDDSSEVPA